MFYSCCCWGSIRIIRTRFTVVTWKISHTCAHNMYTPCRFSSSKRPGNEATHSPCLCLACSLSCLPCTVCSKSLFLFWKRCPTIVTIPSSIASLSCCSRPFYKKREGGREGMICLCLDDRPSSFMSMLLLPPPPHHSPSSSHQDLSGSGSLCLQASVHRHLPLLLSLHVHSDGQGGQVLLQGVLLLLFVHVQCVHVRLCKLPT